MMRNFIRIFLTGLALTLFLEHNTNSQSINWTSLLDLGNDWSNIEDMILDGEDIYVLASVSTYAYEESFGNLSGPGYIIAKYNLQGSLIWAKSIKTNSYPYQPAGRILKEGDKLFVAVEIWPSVIFTDTLGNSTGSSIMLPILAIYSSDGTFLKSKVPALPTDSYSYKNPFLVEDIGTTALGEYYLLISFSTGVIFNKGKDDVISFVENKSGQSSRSFALVKYDSAFNILWARRITNSDKNYAPNIISGQLELGADGDVFVAGNSLSSILFESGTSSQSLSGGTSFAFLAKYSSDGNLLMAKRLINEYKKGDSRVLSDMKVDNDGNIITTGYFDSGDINLDDPMNVLANQLQIDNTTFLMKMDANGEIIWTSYILSIPTLHHSFNKVHKLAIDNNNNYYISGQFLEKVFFDHLQFALDQPYSSNDANNTDLFVASYNKDGKFIDASRMKANIEVIDGYTYNRNIDLALVAYDDSNIIFGGKFVQDISLCADTKEYNLRQGLKWPTYTDIFLASMNIHDLDGDGINNDIDNCVFAPNFDQEDKDNDGYGQACECDDNNAKVNPHSVWYADNDGDGYGNPTLLLGSVQNGLVLSATFACEQPANTVTNNFDCNDNQNPDICQILLSLDENDIDPSEIKLYPVPSNWEIYVEFPNPKSSIVYYSIFSNSGKKVFSGKTAKQSINLEFNDLQSGVYHLILQIKDHIYSRKFIIDK